MEARRGISGVCVCVCEREREREGGGREFQSVFVSVCMHVYMCLRVLSYIVSQRKPCVCVCVCVCV